LAGAPPQTPLEELTALPRPLAGFKGPTSKGREGRGREGERKGEREGRGESEGKERGGDGKGGERGGHPRFLPGLTPLN